jgi:hypothetical protein
VEVAHHGKAPRYLKKQVCERPTAGCGGVGVGGGITEWAAECRRNVLGRLRHPHQPWRRRPLFQQPVRLRGGAWPDTTATANGFFYAANAVGSNVTALAGTGGPLDFLNLAANFGNATDGAASTVEAGGGAINLAANLGGNANTGGGMGFSDLNISARDGFGNVALNVIGNRNTVSAGDGFLNFATNVGGQRGRGSDSRVTTTDSLSAAFQSQTF